MRPDGPELSPVAEKKRPTVIKIGGSTLGHLDTTLEDLVALQRRGDLPVVVHGGGATISEWMQRQGIMPRLSAASVSPMPQAFRLRCPC